MSIAKDKKIENNNLTEKTKSQIKKADDDIFSSYLALMVLSAIFESSNKYSGGSYSSSYNKSGSSSSNSSYSNQQNTSNEDVYICTSGKASGCCRTVVVTSGRPTTSGCCPRSDGNGCSWGHSWSNCGKSGNRNYQCSSCGIAVRTVSQPKNSCCPVNDCGSMHYWREIK